MPPLYLLIVLPPFLVPNRMAHWALYLPAHDKATTGQLYSVKKESLSSEITKSVNDYFDPETLKQKALIAIPGIWLGHAVLLQVCTEITDGRRFNLFTRNCQDWVEEVIARLEEKLGVYPRTNISALVRSHGYTPLKG